MISRQIVISGIKIVPWFWLNLDPSLRLFWYSTLCSPHITPRTMNTSIISRSIMLLGIVVWRRTVEGEFTIVDWILNWLVFLPMISFFLLRWINKVITVVWYVLMVVVWIIVLVLYNQNVSRNKYLPLDLLIAGLPLPGPTRGAEEGITEFVVGVLQFSHKTTSDP